MDYAAIGTYQEERRQGHDHAKADQFQEVLPMLRLSSDGYAEAPPPRSYDPTLYYNGDEFATNFEGRSVSFAIFLLRPLASQARNVREFVKAKQLAVSPSVLNKSASSPVDRKIRLQEFQIGASGARFRVKAARREFFNTLLHYTHSG